MDKRALNREKAKSVVDRLHARHIQVPDPYQRDKIIDPESGNMLLYYDSWSKDHRTYGCYLHLKVAEDGKVWVQNDGTDIPVIDELEAAGIPVTDMVVGWHHPAARKYTEFAEG